MVETSTLIISPPVSYTHLLQIMMIGLRWQLIIVVVIVFLLLSIGWQRLNKYDWRQDWKAILFYSMIIFLATQILYLGSRELYGDEGSIHIEAVSYTHLDSLWRL